MRPQYVLAGCLILALVPALIVGSIILDHNPQGEFQDYETGKFTAEFYLTVGTTWLIWALPFVAMAAIIHEVIERFRK